MPVDQLAAKPSIVLGTSGPPADQVVIDAVSDAVPLAAEAFVCQVTVPDQGLERWLLGVHRTPHLLLPTMTQASADDTKKRQNDRQTVATETLMVSRCAQGRWHAVGHEHVSYSRIG